MYLNVGNSIGDNSGVRLTVTLDVFKYLECQKMKRKEWD